MSVDRRNMAALCFWVSVECSSLELDSVDQQLRRLEN